MTTSESKCRFLLQNESIRIDSNSELECSKAYLRGEQTTYISYHRLGCETHIA